MMETGGFVSFQQLSEGVILPQWVALLFTCSIFAGVAWAYRSHGLCGVAVVGSQVMAIMAVQLSTKLVLESGFAYPTCIASLHFLCVWLASWTVERRSATVAKEKILSFVDKFGSAHESTAWYVKRILPIAVLQTLNVVLNTSSLMYIGAGFNAIIGILCPVLTALVSATLGARITSLAWAGIAIAIAGDAVISIEGLKNITKSGEPLSLALFGMCLGVGALFARSVRSVLMDCQMNEYAADKACPRLLPTQVVALASPAVFAFGFVLTLALEGCKPYFALLSLKASTSLLLAFSTACAVYLSLMGMVLIKMLGAAAAQIAGKLNILVTVALSSAFLHERLSLGFIVGAAAVLAGAAIFERAKATPALIPKSSPPLYSTV